MFNKLKINNSTITEFKSKLTSVDGNYHQQRQVLMRIQTKLSSCVDSIKDARRHSNDADVNYYWDEIKSLKSETVTLKRDLRRTGLERIGLKKYISGLERHMRRKDIYSARKLLERIHNSSIDEKLMADNINEQDYLDELNAVLDSTNADVEIDTHDPDKDKFLSDLDALIIAEDHDDHSEMEKLDQSIHQNLESEKENDG